jgi:hypothetical protein
LTRRPRSGEIAGVPKYDAFGREIGEDTLKGLGGSPSPAPAESSWEARTDREEATWQAAERVEVARQQAADEAADVQAERTEDARQDAAGESRYTATPRPTFVRPGAEGAQRQALASQLSGVLAQAAATRASASGPTVRRRTAGRGCLVTIVILVVVFAALGAIGAIVGSVDVKTEGGTSNAIPEAVKPKPAPKGLGPGSLVRQDRFAAALRQIRTKGGGRLTNLRLAPERIDATLLTGAGRLRNVQIKPGGALERFGPDSGAGFDQTSTIPFARINAAAPQRLARAGAERIGVKVATLQYLVPTTFNGSVAWAAYFTRGRYVIGDASGRFQRKYP